MEVSFVSCVWAISLLPNLEPMAGAALAINLAYLNLRRFRYRSEIRRHAENEIKTLNPENKPEFENRLTQNLWYNQVHRLARLPDNESYIQSRTTLPPGAWGVFYLVLFEFHQDRWVSFFLTGISLGAFVIGTAHAVGHWLGISCLFSPDWIGISFYVLVASTLIPIIFVFLGGWIVKNAKAFVSQNVSELEKLMKEAVPAAKVRPATIPPGFRVK